MEDELQFSDYYNAIKANWIVASIAFLAVFGLVLAYTLLSSPVYQAKSSVLFTGQDQTTFLLGSTAIKTTDLETQRQIILSSSVMNQVYAKYPKSTFGLVIMPVKNSNVIEITVESLAPGASMAIANKVAESYTSYIKEARKSEAVENTQFITEQIDRYTVELDGLNAQVLHFQNICANMTQAQKLEFQTIQRELTAKNKIYDSLLLKRGEAGLAAKERSGSARILSYADPPQKPIKPVVPLNLALGVILGLGAALGAAMLMQKLGETGKKKKFNW